jgi:hypothetical protein
MALTLAAVIAGGACTSSPTATRAFPLPSDGWKLGQAETGVILTGDFEATLTSHGACAWLGPARYVIILWPAGYQVKFLPTELLGPDGQVVARAGQYVGFEGGHVTPGMSPPAYCGPTEGAFMLEGSQ